MQVELITKTELGAFKKDLIEEIRLLIDRQNENPAGFGWKKSSEVCKLLDCSPSTLQNLRDNGKVTGSKVLGTWYYRLTDLESMMQEAMNEN